jgi:hypothetical protein
MRNTLLPYDPMRTADHYRQCRSKKGNISTAVASNAACVISLHCHLLPCVRHENVYPGIVCARHLAGQTQKPASAASPTSGSTAHQQAAPPVLGHAAPSGGQQGAMMVHRCHWGQAHGARAQANNSSDAASADAHNTAELHRLSPPRPCPCPGNGARNSLHDHAAVTGTTHTRPKL